ncbi:MAG: 2-hydroxyacid dehydrogenase [Deltaproteobacteria bacterium]
MRAAPRVVVTRPFPGQALERAAQRLDLWVGPPGGTERTELLARIADAQGLVCTLDDRVDEPLLSRAPALRVVATPAAGFDHIDLAAARARNLWVCHAPDATTEATADLAFALLLAAARRLVEADGFVRSGQFAGWSPSLFLGLELSGSTLGVVGAGRIGRAMLRRAHGFGMRLLYHRRQGPDPELERELGAAFRPFPSLLAESDVVSLHVPLTPETHHLVADAAFARMRPGAILVNSSRGAVVDEAALARALGSGRLRAAGLDVFEREPEVHPELLASPRVVLAPHLGSATEQSRDAMMASALTAVTDVLLDARPPARALIAPSGP